MARPEAESDRGGFRRGGRRGRNRFRRGEGGGAPHGASYPSPGASYSPHEAAGLDRLPPTTPLVVEGTLSGWFDPSRDSGSLRLAANSYLPDPADPFIPPALVRLHQLRRGDKLDVTYGRDHRGRLVVIEVQQLNDGSPVVLEKRPEFNTLTASYPDRKLTLETGRPAKSGPSSRGAPSTSLPPSATASGRSSWRRRAPARPRCCRPSWKGWPSTTRRPRSSSSWWTNAPRR
jgi:transcription termination factor Rho